MKAVKNSHSSAWIASILLAATAAPSFADFDYHLERQDKAISLDLAAGIGYRTGDLQWSIASDVTGGETPNILSELTYSDIELEEFNSRGRLIFNYGFLEGVIVEGRFVSGEATDGTNQDSDYNGDNRTGEYSRSLSDAEGSETTEFELIFGYQVKLSESFSITPKMAYSYNEQHMKMTNGVQILDTRAMALSLGPFNSDLNSHYTAEWEGFWLGGDLTWQSGNHRLNAEIQYHIQDYYAEANWNLREDFEHPVSFAHWSDGDGLRWKLNYRYQFSRYFSAWVEASAEDFEADPGRDVVYFSNGTRGATRLNGVTWEASGYAFGVEFNY